LEKNILEIFKDPEQHDIISRGRKNNDMKSKAKHLQQLKEAGNEKN
jgi:hypothetical protein